MLKKKSVLPQRSPPNEQNLYLFKTPPSYVKKNGAFILNAPSTSNKAVTTTRSPKMTKFVCLFKTPPPLLVRLLFDLLFALGVQHCKHKAFMTIRPPPASKKLSFCVTLLFEFLH